MTNNKYLAWTSFILFILSGGMILLFVLLASMLGELIENPGVIILVVGAFSFMGTIMGFLSFKAPQAKVGGVGGLVILLLVLFIIPVGRETSVSLPPPEVGFQEQDVYTGIAELDLIIETVLADNPKDELQLLQFSTLECTHADGLGGPPRCNEGEDEGAKVEVFPFLGSEGHHSRKSEMDDWPGISATGVYAVYRVSQQSYFDANYPAGKYAIIFLGEEDSSYVTAQVTDGKIIRLDYTVGNPTDIDLTQVASEILLTP